MSLLSSLRSIAAAKGRLPDFLIIGAAKAGTTALYTYLSRHPQIFGSRPKEPCFFDPDVNWHRGRGWYGNLFSRALEDQLCFEASTNYTRFPQVADVPKRIHELMPNVKLIYMMRHPVERAYSHYLHRFTKEVRPWHPIDVTFEDFVARDPMCLDSSDYAQQIEEYLKYFPREQLLLLRQEKLDRDPSSVLETVLRFLGLPLLELGEEFGPKVNTSASYLKVAARKHLVRSVKSLPGMMVLDKALPSPLKQWVLRALERSPYGSLVARLYEPVPMRPETRQALLERYSRSVHRIEHLMDEDLSDWRT